jgi:hypothetical protein
VKEGKNMKKSLAISCILMLTLAIACTSVFVQASVLPIVRVQGPVTASLSGNSITVTLPNTPQSGDVLIAVMGLKYAGSGQPQVGPQFTETGVNWPGLSHSFTSGGSTSGSSIQVWWGIVTSASASKTITINLPITHGSGSVTSATVNICEYSGLDTNYMLTNYVDQSTDNAGSAKTIDTDVTATTTYANELWVGGALAGSAQSSPTQGFTLFGGSVNNGISVSYLENIVSTTGQAESGTTAASTGSWKATLVTFPAATSPFVAPEGPIGALSMLIACAGSFMVWKIKQRKTIPN